jgi:hypothetical protein
MKKLLFLLVVALATVTNPLSADTIPMLTLRINKMHLMYISSEKSNTGSTYLSEDIIGSIVFSGENFTVGVAKNDAPKSKEDVIIGTRHVTEFHTTKEKDGSVLMYEILTDDDIGMPNGFIQILFTKEKGVIVMDPYFNPYENEYISSAFYMYECEVIP